MLGTPVFGTGYYPGNGSSRRIGRKIGPYQPLSVHERQSSRSAEDALAVEDVVALIPHHKIRKFSFIVRYYRAKS